MCLSIKLKSKNHQSGIVLIFALFVLVAMSLAAVALVRSIDTGSKIAGNLSFRIDAVANADIVIEEAIASIYSLLKADPNVLDKSNIDLGYYANQINKLDVTGNSRSGDSARVLINWGDDHCKNNLKDGGSDCNLKPVKSSSQLTGDNSASYIVFRMCKSEGPFDLAATGCVTANQNTVSNNCQGGINYENEGRCDSAEGVSPYYRVLARILGPRNTVSYAEALVHF